MKTICLQWSRNVTPICLIARRIKLILIDWKTERQKYILLLVHQAPERIAQPNICSSMYLDALSC
jgi:hypothetical protein